MTPCGRGVATGLRAVVVLLVCGTLASAQRPVSTVQAKQEATVPALLLSDIHFDPFRDVSKVARLAQVPAERWAAILDEKEPAANAAELAEKHRAMLTTCFAAVDDTDQALLTSTLSEAKKHLSSDGFVTVSGDLLVHGFECRYKLATATTTAEPVAKFAAETARYVMLTVEAAFPRQPVYFALGNNDSGCGGYRLDRNDRFLAATSGALLRGLRGATPEEITQAREDYEAGGYYGVALRGGVEHTRLLVVDDIFESQPYKPCGDGALAKKIDGDPRIAWLDAQLGAAERRGEKVWVMGHIPPGPDVYSTLRHFFTMCSQPPPMFLASSALGDVLSRHADAIQLAVFGHTHTDELRVLEREGQPGKVAVKLVGSVSPVHGNQPSFTVGSVVAATGRLADYTVYTTPDWTSAHPAWAREYGFDETYHEADFSASSVARLVSRLQADKGAESAETKAYAGFFSAGRADSPLFIVWPQYGCALTNDRAEDFRRCLCPAR